jgi:hypothetical protein
MNNNLPLLYYYTNITSYYYWCYTDIFYKDGKQNLLIRNQTNEELYNYLTKNLSVKYILTNPNYNKYNPAFSAFLEENSNLIFNQSIYYLHKIKPHLSIVNQDEIDISSKGIPFTNFQTNGRKNYLEIINNSYFLLSINDSEYYYFEDLPIKILDFSNDSFIVFTRTIFSGDINIYYIEKAILTKIDFETSNFLFKNAYVENNTIYLVVYNVITKENELIVYELISNSLIKKENHVLDFEGRYDIGDIILINKIQNLVHDSLF